MINAKILDNVLSILKEFPLCDHCLGRLFARLGKGVDNSERGHSIKLLLTMFSHLMLKDDESKDLAINNLRILASNGFFKPAQDLLKHIGCDFQSVKECFICRNIFENLDEYVKRILPILNEYDFNTFLIGTKIPAAFLEREDIVRSHLSIDVGESLKSELNRLIGKKLQVIIGKKVSFDDPDIVIIVDIENFNVSINPKPIFIYGRYKKLMKGIPQTTWFCSNCWGKGCAQCNYTGKRYSTSISELIIGPILNATNGVKGIFHGAGREDIDTLTLGNGRPFIVEIKDPKHRTVDLAYLERAINDNARGMVEVKLIRFSNRKEVRKLKSLSAFSRKVYQALIEVDGEVDENSLKKLEEYFSNREIKQYTPLRVLHRRANKIRVKKVYSVKTELIDSRRFKAIIECQGGLYVKELISGDNNRTIPNFSQILQLNAKCIELSVIFVSEEV